MIARLTRIVANLKAQRRAERASGWAFRVWNRALSVEEIAAREPFHIAQDEEPLTLCAECTRPIFAGDAYLAGAMFSPTLCAGCAGIDDD